MGGRMNRLGKFLDRDFREQRRLMEAAVGLGVFRIAILTLPFRVLATRLGEQGKESSVAPLNDTQMREAIMVSRAVQTMSRNLPWDCKCLVQAAAGKTMLRRRYIPATLYLALAKDEDQKLIAHAWLRSGDLIVTGKAGMENYTVVSVFS
jgi:hypothetical protein